eukprot:498427_1
MKSRTHTYTNVQQEINHTQQSSSQPFKSRTDESNHITLDTSQTNVTNFQTNDKTNEKFEKPSKHLCTLILMILMWLILITYILTFVITVKLDLPDYIELNWIIYIVIPVYIVYFIEFSFCSKFAQSFTQTETTNDTREYIRKLIECKPVINWKIEHYHQEFDTANDTQKDVVTVTENRAIVYESWLDQSVYFDLNDFDKYFLIKLKISVHDEIRPAFLDATFGQCYDEAYNQSLTLTTKRDKLMRIIPQMQFVSTEIKMDALQVEKHMIVKNDNAINGDCKVNVFWFYFCSLFTLSYFYRVWLDKKYIQRQVVFKKAIKFNSKFPYCFVQSDDIL